MSSSNRLDLVAVVLSVDDAFGADGRAVAGEAVVTYKLIWMLWTWRATGRYMIKKLRLPIG